jgi:DNA primase
MNNEIINTVNDILGSYEKIKDEHIYFCPHCNHKKRKLSVNYDKNKFKCWVCMYSGNSIYFLIKRYGTYEHLKTFIAFSDTISLTSIYKLFFDKESQVQKKNKCILPDEYEFILYSDHFFAQKALEYLYKDRGLSEEDIYKWKIGICTKGKYSGRIIFPSFDENGDCNFFVARGFLPDTKYTYLYSEINKNLVIINEANIDWNKPVYIVEGMFDAIKINNNCIPLLGKTIVVEDDYSKLLLKLMLYNTKIYLCLDNDLEKGVIKNRSLELAEQLLKYGISNIEVLDPYPHKDFGEISKDKIKEFLSHKTKVNSKFDILKKQIEMAVIN